MADTLPYLVTPGSIKNALERIRSAATPDRVTADFITTKLQIKGGTGRALIPYLKKIGFVASDGAPTELYKRFRNPATAGSAVAQAVKIGYQALGEVNEYFYELDDKALLGVILQVTGAEAENAVAKYTLSTLKHLKAFADFETRSGNAEAAIPDAPLAAQDVGVNENSKGTLGRTKSLNLSYTINLNLPPSSDQAVFNAIFRSLKENLLLDDDE